MIYDAQRYTAEALRVNAACAWGLQVASQPRDQRALVLEPFDATTQKLLTRITVDEIAEAIYLTIAPEMVIKLYQFDVI